MAPVDTVEIANRQRAFGRKMGMVVAAKNFHGRNYRFYSAAASAPVAKACAMASSSPFVIISLYIVD
jgi:hypothetical protein